MNGSIVSIIIPVYNKEGYLRRCMNSVLKQTYKDIEVILIDDGSTDDSESIIKEYSNNKNIFYYYKSNGGLSSARNYGMQYIHGEFVFFLDPDDELAIDAIASMVENAKGFDIVIGNFKYIHDNGVILNRPIIEKKDIDASLMEINDVYDYFYGRCYGISACNKLYRNEFLKKSSILFQPNAEIYAEDLLFNMKILTKNPNIQVIENITYYYYQNEGSITKSYKKNFPERFCNLINDYIGTPQKRDDVVCFTIFNAINSISQQEKTINDIKNAVNALLKNVDYIDFMKSKYIQGIESKKGIDYKIMMFGLKKARILLFIYLKIKNLLRRG